MPRKGLSQNFLIDGNIIRKILKSSEVQENDLVLEVGSGPGSLSQALLENKAAVIAVEKDDALAQALQRFQVPPNHLQIFSEDILTFDLDEKLKPLLQEGQKAKLIANLPYHLTTPILAKMISRTDLFSSLTVMVQEEVARRMTAEPSTSEYSSLTVFLNFYSKPRYAFTVSRNCFYPIPKVDSAIVILDLHEPPLTEEKAVDFFKLTRTAFGHRRKMLRASLKPFYEAGHVSQALESIGKNPLARPENLSLDEFLQLFRYLEN